MIKEQCRQTSESEKKYNKIFRYFFLSVLAITVQKLRDSEK